MGRRTGLGVVGFLAGIAVVTGVLAHGPPDVDRDYNCVANVKYKAPKLKVDGSEILLDTLFTFVGDQCTFRLGETLPEFGAIRTGRPDKVEMSAKYDLRFPGIMTADWDAFLIQEIRDAYAARGQTVDDVTLLVDQEKSKGKLTFKRKPTPVGPVDSVKVNLQLVYEVTTVVGGVSETSKLGLTLKGAGI
jgi:hypothetical protein